VSRETLAPASAKHPLRATLRAELRGLDPATARAAADRVGDGVLALPEVVAAQRVLTCLSFGTELDTWRLVDRLLASGREVFVPRAEAATGRLHVHRYPCELETLSFGLRQPRRGGPEVPAESLDVALVLGLAFDRRGFRLGHGRGYFDRFLAGRAFPAVGLAYDAQLREALPVEPHDVAMTAVVTEKQVWRPPPSP
jgi:5-formyltetrahydrofolate cyclo-ligase